VVQYGQFAKISDLLSDVAIDPVLENLSERFGIAASKTIEELIVSELANNCSNQNVNNRANFAAIQASDLLSHKELIEAMVRQKADFIGPHESGQYVVVSAGANDPLDQFATVGYKIHGFAAKYLDQNSKRVIAINGASGI
ncbi:hypothetical protein EB118_21870, partial [bacterium]|nr:hypothetical protein [bacterium]